MTPVVHSLVVWSIAVVASFYLLRQVRKPGRWAGQPFVWIMNASHSGLTTWGLSHIAVGKGFVVLDVGCGGGATVRRLAAMAQDGKVSGIDYAEGSVAVSRRTNADLIRAGRVDIRQGTVSALPFTDGVFDLATAVETHYYWPDLPNDVREIRRVLKPGGTLLMIAETYAGGRFDSVQRLVMKPLKSTHLTADEHRQLFEGAGFSEVRVTENRKRGWICVTGRKPLTEL